MLWKTALVVHFLALCGLLGSTATIQVLKVAVERRGEMLPPANGLDLLILIDRALTGPSALVLGLSGIILAGQYGLDAVSLGWLQALFAIWLLSGLNAHLFLIPRLHTLGDRARTRGLDDPEYIRMSRVWNVVSAVQMLLQALAIAIAVTRP